MKQSICLIGRAPSRLRDHSEPATGDRGEAAVRARRVTILVLATGMLGLLDLAFTLTYMRSVGMVEVNPLARFMIGVGGAGQLVRFKLFTIALSGGALYLIRHRRGAELCAWASLAALIALSLHWARYTAIADEFGLALILDAMMYDHRWVAIAE